MTTTRVAIVDYGMGNLRSVSNAFKHVGSTPYYASNPADLANATHVVLPGVGSFSAAIKTLKTSGWVDALTEIIQRDGRPFLGICLGMQLIASLGMEHGRSEGLGWIDATVTKLEPPRADGDAVVHRVPHVGWNDLRVADDSVLLRGIPDGSDVYFTHSFAMRAKDHTDVAAWCQHGEEFAAAIECENVYATQFHPEKSQSVGLHILRNFVQC